MSQGAPKAWFCGSGDVDVLELGESPNTWDIYQHPKPARSPPASLHFSHWKTRRVLIFVMVSGAEPCWLHEEAFEMESV